MRRTTGEGSRPPTPCRTSMRWAGGPLTALQLVGWPRSKVPFEALSEVMAGGADVMAIAEVTIAGGHSVDNEAPVYGFAVTGTVSPARVVTNGAARPGDLIVLTKPLGTGVAASALKAGLADPALRDAAVGTMVALNGPASTGDGGGGCYVRYRCNGLRAGRSPPGDNDRIRGVGAPGHGCDSGTGRDSRSDRGRGVSGR